MIKRIFLAILFLLIACNGWATDRYVKNGGSDTGTCTNSASPCESIAYVQTQASSGDTVYFDNASEWAAATPVLSPKEGVIYDGATWGAGTRAKLTSSSATVNSGVVEIAFDDVTVKGFDISGGDGKTGGILVAGYSGSVPVSVDNILIDNCVIHDIGDPADCGNSWQSGIDISPRNEAGGTPHTASNVTVKNTVVHDTCMNGIAVYPSWSGTWNPSGNRDEHITIRNCEVYNAGKNDGAGHDGSGLGIHVKDDSQYVTIEFCNLHDNLNYGILLESHAYDDGTAPQDVIIRYNLIYKNGDYGIDVSNGSNEKMTADFYGNIFYDNGATISAGRSADILFAANDYLSGSVFNIYNNTFLSTATNAAIPHNLMVGNGSSAPTGSGVWNLKNNIFYMGNYAASSWEEPIWDGGNLLVHSNNLIYRATGTDKYAYDGTTHFTSANIATWETTGLQTSDPSFTGGTLPTGFCEGCVYGTDLRPNTTYFAITSGDALGNGAVLASTYNKAINYAGTSSTYNRGAAWDIGAYEYTYDGGAIVNTGAVFSGCTF